MTFEAGPFGQPSEEPFAEIESSRLCARCPWPSNIRAGVNNPTPAAAYHPRLDGIFAQLAAGALLQADAREDEPRGMSQFSFERRSSPGSRTSGTSATPAARDAVRSGFVFFRIKEY
jgi:hypothetical protein